MYIRTKWCMEGTHCLKKALHDKLEKSSLLCSAGINHEFVFRQVVETTIGGGVGAGDVGGGGEGGGGFSGGGGGDGGGGGGGGGNRRQK